LRLSVLFSEPKIPQCLANVGGSAKVALSVLFSEPKIPQSLTVVTPAPGAGFQCSSASRKFLNPGSRRWIIARMVSFSALQRAENSSIIAVALQYCAHIILSVLFSEPKIPQFQSHAAPTARVRLSVLFSEPKIPQSLTAAATSSRSRAFSALQRAENSSIIANSAAFVRSISFQCSSASRKFLNASSTQPIPSQRWLSVLFSEPKIPQ